MTTPIPNTPPPEPGHAGTLENLPAYIAGGLSSAERSALEAHVAACAECAAELEGLRGFDTTLRNTLAGATPAGDFEDRLVSHFRENTVRRNRMSFPLLRRAGLGVAAAIALGATGVMANHLVSRDMLSASQGWPEKVRAAVDVRKINVNAWFEAKTAARQVASAPMSTPLDRFKTHDEMDEWHKSGGAVAVDGDKLADRYLAALRTGNENRSGFLYAADQVRQRGRAPDAPVAEEYEGRSTGKLDRRGGEQAEAARDHGEKKNKARGDDYLNGTPATLLSFNGGWLGDRNHLTERLTKSGSGALTTGDRIRLEEFDKAPAQKEGELNAVYDGKVSGVVGRSLVERNGSVFYQQLQPGQDRLGLAVNAPRPSPEPRRPGDGPTFAATAAATQAASVAPQAARKIIRNGSVEYEVRSFDDASSTVTKLVEEESGFIASTNSDRLPNGKMRGVITLRCPPENLDRLVLKLRGIGELKAQQIGSSDVTKQYTDLESELRALRAMEERLLNLIKTGKGEVKDLVEAEKQLGEYRVKIEKIEGEIRYYNNLVGMATLTVTAYEKDIRQAAAAVETESVTMSVEAEDVEARYRDARKMIADIKGRIIESDLKRTDMEQLSARIVCEVPQEQADHLANQFRQLGRVARLDRDRRVTSDGSASTQPAKIETKDTRLVLSMYNLANIAPRETTVINVAVPNVEELYRAVLGAVKREVTPEKDGKPPVLAGKVVSSSMSGQKPEQMTADVFAVLRASEATSVLELVRGVKGGEVLTSSVSVSSDTAGTTAEKRGVQLRIMAMASVQPREVVTVTAAAVDASERYSKLLLGIQQMEGAGLAQVVKTNLSEPNAASTTGKIEFSVHKSERKAVETSLAENGVDVMTREVERAEDGSARTESKVLYKVTILSVESVPPVRTTNLSVEVSDVPEGLKRVREALAKVGGREVDSTLARTAKGGEGGTISIEVPSAVGEAMVARLKELGVEKFHQVVRDSKVPEGKLSRDRIDVTLTNRAAPVQSTVSNSFSSAGQALLVSLYLLLTGVMFLGPWLLVMWIVWKLLRRKPKPVTA